MTNLGDQVPEPTPSPAPAGDPIQRLPGLHGLHCIAVSAAADERAEWWRQQFKCDHTPDNSVSVTAAQSGQDFYEALKSALTALGEERESLRHQVEELRKDAARWRALRDTLTVCSSGNGDFWWLETLGDNYISDDGPAPSSATEAADRLIDVARGASQQAQKGTEG